jgi:hypothetical protein
MMAPGGCAGCSQGCADCGSPCCEDSFLSRLRARFQRQSSCCENPCDECGKGPGLLDRLRARFQRNDCCGGCNDCGQPASMHPAKGPEGERLKMPKDGDKKGKDGDDKKGKVGDDDKKGKVDDKDVKQGQSAPPIRELTPASKGEKEIPNPFELDRRYESRVHHAADYSNLTGQLFYVHADGGLWVLRYAPLATEDANGGGVVLARDRGMDSYRDGDLVTVHGEVLRARGSIYLGAPLYRASSIRLVDRAQP